jgi:hypothetical protein
MSNDSFGSLFVRYQELYETLHGLLSKASGPLDLHEMTEALRRRHPEVEIPPSELRDAVLRAATSAGIPVKLDGGG